ncbi:hypothetical protein Ahy_B06g082100 [Arachis hypogaea]|uniref:Uncharacterized protein n=1 Tax=Arachis hypogaea TaxID=3818 RepID=A0A444YMS7_ARAHY|nr:hypothetical protein Ahy_B06g082100 [Arachis hypogaea]
MITPTSMILLPTTPPPPTTMPSLPNPQRRPTHHWATDPSSTAPNLPPLAVFLLHSMHSPNCLCSKCFWMASIEVLALGAVVEAKPQLVGIHERVRTDNGSQQPASAPSSTPEGGKRMSTATNPNAEFWARSLRCGWSRPDLHLFSNLMIPLHMPWKEELPFCPHPHNTHFAVSVWTRDWRR